MLKKDMKETLTQQNAEIAELKHQLRAKQDENTKLMNQVMRHQREEGQRTDACKAIKIALETFYIRTTEEGILQVEDCYHTRLLQSLLGILERNSHAEAIYTRH